jgi:hypothetical protein
VRAPRSPAVSETPRSRRPLVVAFALGGLLTLGVVIPRLWPVQTYAAYCRLAYGGAPSAAGVVLRVRPAPPGAGGPEGGPWLLLELRNIEARPTLVHLLDPPGAEWGLEATDAEGERLPSVGGLDQVQASRPVRAVSIPAGGRVSQVVDLSRFVRVPASGRLRIVARRVSLKDGHAVTSEALSLDLGS